jgi:hypothetical protein
MSIYFYLSLLFIPLAVWRISNMLADVDQHGPFGILDKMRVASGMRYDAYSNIVAEPGSLFEGLTCIYCNSTWIGAGFAVLLLLSPEVAFYVSFAFALSTIVIIIEKCIIYRS